MEYDQFVEIVEETFLNLPEAFRSAIDNVRIIIEDYPTDEIVAAQKLPSRHHLLGLYHGIPLPNRVSAYGSYPVMPDTITLFQKNIEAICRNDEEIREQIRKTLLHEIGHYFGMTEHEIRSAGY